MGVRGGALECINIEEKWGDGTGTIRKGCRRIRHCL